MTDFSLFFNFKGADLMIQGNTNDYMKDLLKKYGYKSDINIKDVYFTLNGEKINEELKLGELNIKDQNIRILVHENIKNSNISLIFSFKGAELMIQGNTNDYMKNIFKKYSIKSDINIKDVYFTLNGQKINEEKKLGDLNITEQTIRISVNENSKGNEKENNIEENKEKKKEEIKEDINIEDNFPISKDIICPTCGDLCILSIEDFKLKLNDCHKKHELSNILLSQFKQTQKIDESKIFCDKCNTIKAEVTGNQLFKCYNCNINICPVCKYDHDKSHLLVDYESLNFVCHTHGEKNIFYCPECHENICDLCACDHDNKHNLIYLRQIFEDKNFQQNFNDFILKLDACKIKIQNLIKILRQVFINIDSYYNICKSLFNRFDLKRKNYQLVMSLNNLNKYNQSISDDIDAILNTKIENKFNVLYKMSEKMKIPKKYDFKYLIGNQEKIKIFGEEFVKNNKDKAKIIFNDKEYELSDLFDINDIKNEDFLELRLKEINTITDLSYMFNECTSLFSIQGESIFNDKNLTNVKYLFNKCVSLETLPDLSKMNTSNIEDMSFVFNNCSSLKLLPDISTWNTDKVTNMKNLFCECTSLTTIPDISKWNISNVTDISNMFCKCSSLIYLPDISCWNTINVVNMSNMLQDCSSIRKMPNLSKWQRIKLKKKINQN